MLLSHSKHDTLYLSNIFGGFYEWGIGHVKQSVEGSVFPTRVGMNRLCGRSWCSRIGVPHTRGDEPFCLVHGAPLCMCSPHAWG